MGKETWRGIVKEIVPVLAGAVAADYVVIGGGSAKLLKAANFHPE